MYRDRFTAITDIQINLQFIVKSVKFMFSKIFDDKHILHILQYRPTHLDLLWDNKIKRIGLFY